MFFTPQVDLTSLQVALHTKSYANISQFMGVIQPYIWTIGVVKVTVGMVLDNKQKPP